MVCILWKNKMKKFQEKFRYFVDLEKAIGVYGEAPLSPSMDPLTCKANTAASMLALDIAQLH